MDIEKYRLEYVDVTEFTKATVLPMERLTKLLVKIPGKWDC